MRQLVLSDYKRETSTSANRLEALSSREMEVFRLVGAGYTNRAAGEKLELSPKTVEKYRAAVMSKLALRDAVALRPKALEMGVTGNLGEGPAPAYKG